MDTEMYEQPSSSWKLEDESVYLFYCVRILTPEDDSINRTLVRLEMISSFEAPLPLHQLHSNLFWYHQDKYAYSYLHCFGRSCDWCCG